MPRIVIANWKMNLTLAEAEAAALRVAKQADRLADLQIIIAPSLLWIEPLHAALKMMPPNLALASQVVSANDDGAYTGDVSAHQLKGLVTYCLVGHSERRRYHHETGSVISDQVKQLLEQNITPIICFGEMSQSKQQSFSPQITADLGRDLSGLSEAEIKKCLLAYEPLWAIGTGNPATPDYAKRAVEHVKHWAKGRYSVALPVLYGGSVSVDDAKALGEIKSIDGLLVGGASLNAKSFLKICADFSHHV